MNFSIYKSIVHLRKLEKENLITDDEWDNIKPIIICRLIHFNPDFYNYSNIGMRVINISTKFCFFELFHKKPEHKYLFFVDEKTDNIFLIAIKNKNGYMLEINSKTLYNKYKHLILKK